MALSEAYTITLEGGRKLSRLQSKDARAISSLDLVDLYILTSLSEGEATITDLETNSPVDFKGLYSRIKKLRSDGQIAWSEDRPKWG